MKEMYIAVCILLCISVTGKASVIKYFEREWNISLNDLTIADEAIGKNNIFPYAKCSLGTWNDRNCTVVLESFHPDGIIYKNKCFTRFDTGTEGLNLLQMRAVKNNNIVFSYIDIKNLKKDSTTAYLRLRVLDTLSCKFHEGKIFINLSAVANDFSKIQGEGFSLTTVLPYKDGSIDTFLNFQNLCDGARCKVSFDANGDLVGKPVSYLSKDVYYNDVKVYADAYYTTRASKDFFVAVNGYKASNRRQVAREDERNQIKLIHVKANGKQKELLHLEEKKSLVADVDVDYHGALSICWAKQAVEHFTTVNCRHYKNNAADFQEQSFQFKLPYAIKTLKVRRTVHSEAPIPALLVLTDESDDQTCESDGNYYIRLISLKTSDNDLALESSHHNSHNMQISGLTCAGKRKQVSISPAWNFEGLNVCVSLTCQQKQTEHIKQYYTMHKLVRQCFSMKYLDRAFD